MVQGQRNPSEIGPPGSRNRLVVRDAQQAFNRQTNSNLSPQVQVWQIVLQGNRAA